MQGLDEQDSVALKPHGSSMRVVFACLGAATLAIAALGALGVGLGLMRQEVGPLSVLFVFLSIAGAILGARRLVMGPPLRIRLNGKSLLVEDGKGVRRGELDVEHGRVEYGYYLIQGRGYRGHIIALRLALAEGKSIVLSVQDTRMVHYWRGDDPWERRYGQGIKLPEATHFAEGVDWQRVVITVGLGGRLQSDPIGS